jgi:hypothetical protein
MHYGVAVAARKAAARHVIFGEFRMYEVNEPPPSPSMPPPVAPPAQVLTYALPGSITPFLPPRPRANMAIAFLGAWLIVSLVSMLSSYWQLELLQRVEGGATVTQEEANGNDRRETLVGVVAIVVYIAIVVFFLRWLHLARKNLDSLGAFGAKHSPGWAIGSWFIPILNLFRPYQITQEIYRGSDPYLRGSMTSGWQFGLGSTLIGWWWFAWIVAGIADRVSSRASRATELDKLIFATRADMFGILMSMIAAVLCISVIRQITDRQEQSAAGAALPLAAVSAGDH